MEDRRFIEETFPVREVSEVSAREKNTRHGQISTMHIWWARRPLAASRATNYAALIKAARSPGEADTERQFIVKLSKGGNSLDGGLLATARNEIFKETQGRPPRVLDPFAGGGSIPLEALRLGCETYASDYNPVAVLLLKCTLEYPQKFGSGDRKTEHGLKLKETTNPLHRDVEKWGTWVLAEAKKEIGSFYPTEKDGAVTVAYIWAKTIPCQNPACNAEIPLMRQFWLCNKEDKMVSVFPYVYSGQVRFRIVGPGYEKMPKNFDPDHGTVSRAVATCLVCGSVVDGDTTRSLFAQGKSREKLIALVLHSRGVSGKSYQIATERDEKFIKQAKDFLFEKRKSLLAEWGMDPIPDEPTPEGKGSGAERAFSLRNYNLNTWGDLFNPRQKLALIAFVERVRDAWKRMLAEGYDPDYAKAVTTYLALAVSKFSATSNSICRWNNNSESIAGKPDQFGTLEVRWDYPECNPFSDSTGTFSNHLESILQIGLMGLPLASMPSVSQGSATSLPYASDFFDAVLTDPPYYDNIPYSYLSDFFYVWLKRAVGHLYPEYFATPLTPKTQEIVAYSNIEGGFEAGKKFFEDMLRKSFEEIHRVLKPNGISLIVYAHKSSAGWESLVNSLLDSGLVVTGAWPLHTERRARMRAKESAALTSSIYMVARKFKRERTGFYTEVRQELKEYLNERLDKIWNEGIYGADFFISAIGSAIVVFGKYEKVIDDEGTIIRADRLLEDVRRIVIDYAVRQVLHNGFAAEIDPKTRLYVLWRWAFADGAVEFDEARKLAQSVGIDLTREWNKGFVKKDKEFIRVLGPDDRDLKSLEGSTELVDTLHHVLLLWKKSKGDDVTKVLKETGFGESDVFYRVAQAISESLPNDNREKKLLEGFLAGRERITKELRKRGVQRRLDE